MVGVEGGQAHYLATVLRMAPGDQLLLFDGTSGEWLGELVEAGKKRVTLTIVQSTRPQECLPDLMLAFAPVKKGRIDWLIEKAVELGVARLQPVITARTIVDKVNLDRLRSHIVEAAEQCGRTSLPAIADPVKLDAFLRAHDPSRALYFADETGGEAASAAFTPGPATILTGPEGGFTPDEASTIRATPGARAVSLGPRILRADTAALAGVAAWMALAGDWS
jgi:16S rRNA (uracil1498-N3)-methyltransferase